MCVWGTERRRDMHTCIPEARTHITRLSEHVALHTYVYIYIYTYIYIYICRGGSPAIVVRCMIRTPF